MIRICKPDVPPKLKRAGIAQTKKDCAAYDANPDDYLNGIRKFKFKRTIYGHNSVKDTLRRAQHGKCCFCEGRFEAFAAADVEHYRPKGAVQGAVQQDENSSRLIPGYYWLAYSWDNLYWCCQVCNRNHKKNYFPLANPNQRARSHTGDIAKENPLILNPGGPEDPRKHVKFRKDLAKGKTKAGRTTIEIVGLNRNSLAEERLARLNELRTFLAIVRLYKEDLEPDAAELVQDASRALALAVQPTAKFSAMAADFLHGTETVKAKAP